MFILKGIKLFKNLEVLLLAFDNKNTNEQTGAKLDGTTERYDYFQHTVYEEFVAVAVCFNDQIMHEQEHRRGRSYSKMAASYLAGEYVFPVRINISSNHMLVFVLRLSPSLYMHGDSESPNILPSGNRFGATFCCSV